MFDKDGAVYVYVTSIELQKSKEFDPIENEKDRGVMFIGCHKFYRDPETDEVIYHFFNQTDFKVNITPFLVKQFLPNGLKNWHGSLNKFIMENEDEL